MKKLILVLALIVVVLFSGCTRTGSDSHAFCVSRGYDGSFYQGWGEGSCYREIGNDTLEEICFDYINGRYYFVECGT